MSLLPRNVADDVDDALDSSRIVVLLGPRQAGKSTLAKVFQSSGRVPHYYTLDDESLRTSAQNDAAGFVAGLAKPAIIDEIQRAPGLLLAIKQDVDEHPGDKGRYLLTGSANLLENKRVTDALPGRAVYIRLWPLAQDEIAGSRSSIIDAMLGGVVPTVSSSRIGRAGYADTIIRGGFPEARLLTATRSRTRFFESYVHSVLQRDLPEVADIRVDPETVERVLRVIAHRSTGLVNYTSLGADLALDRVTLRSHLGLLEQMFLVRRVTPWSANLASRPVKTPKVLVTDSGLTAALVGVDADRFAAPDQGGIGGALLETFITAEILKYQGWAKASTKMFFYRDQKQREVDVVLESAGGDTIGFEVKSAATVAAKDARGLTYLRDAMDKQGSRFKAGCVVYTGQHTVKLGDRIWAMPAEGLWR